MPTTTAITTTYAGEAALPYIRAAVLSPVTLDNVTQHLNIKYKEVLRTGTGSVSFADDACDFTDPNNTITLGEVIIEPKRLMLNREFCKNDFLRDWDALSMGASASDNLPASFEDFVLAFYSEKVGDKLESLIWSGDKTNGGEFDGFITKLSSADVTGAALDKSNIIAELEAVEDAVPTAIYQADDFAYYVPTSAGIYYIQAQAALGYVDKFHVGKSEMNFHGRPMIVCPGMPDDTIIAARKEDLHFGTALISDWTEVQLIDMGIIGERNVRLVMRFTADTAVTNRTQIVYRFTS